MPKRSAPALPAGSLTARLRAFELFVHQLLADAQGNGGDPFARYVADRCTEFARALEQDTGSEAGS